MSAGIVPQGPGTYLVSEMRAPVLGGAAEAQRVAIGKAEVFCASQHRVFAPIMMTPGGYPGSRFGPTSFTSVFTCADPSAQRPPGHAAVQPPA